MTTSPLPNRSAASAIFLCSAVVILPFLVITRTLKLFVPLLCRHPSAFTLVISSGVTVTAPGLPSALTTLKNVEPSKTFVLV